MKLQINSSVPAKNHFRLPLLCILISVDLSFNNLSGPVPRFASKTFSIVGKPLICQTGSEQQCHGMTLMPMSMTLNTTQDATILPKSKGHKVALAISTSLGCISLLIFGLALIWWRRRYNQEPFFDVKDRHHEEVSLGNLRKFQFMELQIATHNFSNKNILGKGGYEHVYKGQLQDGTCVAVKCLKDGGAAGGEKQFQTEVEMISLAVHRHLLRLYGVCMTPTEKPLVYPYMSNGSAASHLKGRPVSSKTTVTGDFHPRCKPVSKKTVLDLRVHHHIVVRRPQMVVDLLPGTPQDPYCQTN